MLDTQTPTLRGEARAENSLGGLLISEVQCILFKHAAKEEVLDFAIVARATETYTTSSGHQDRVPEGHAYVVIGSRVEGDQQRFWDRVDRLRSVLREIDDVREARLTQQREQFVY